MTVSADSLTITADQLKQVREPLSWRLHLGERAPKDGVVTTLRRAMLGAWDDTWTPPHWLLPHQVVASQRVLGIINTFGGALLCDSVGLGKTYMGLAIATRYRQTTLVVPAVLIQQWQSVCERLDLPLTMVSHESLSRRNSVPEADLIIVDEAHRFRNTRTVRYSQLARSVRTADVLLMTANPVVNSPRDILGLIRLFASDHALALFGVRSLERAINTNGRADVSNAISAVTVARSPETAAMPNGAIPKTLDHPIATPPPIEQARLTRAIYLMERLEFPAFGDRNANELLRTHVHHRLASSAAACVECLKRHRTYLDHAIRAANRGQRLSRRAARLLFDLHDELQMELDLSAVDSTAAPIAQLTREQARIDAIIDLFREDKRSPKIEHLANLITARRTSSPSHKTIVFTNSIATARAVAARLGWHRVAAVTGNGARIASGRIPRSAVLALFSPRSRNVTPPPPHSEIDVLIATDLLSEGLDLQDADGIVHFDLPWNPLRLQQRIGRAVRLGSQRSDVHVWWFAPPASLEKRLQMRQRIATKLHRQLGLGVSVTSAVGRARVLATALSHRERLAETVPSTHNQSPQYTVVAAPLTAAFAVRYSLRGVCLRGCVVVSGSPPSVVTDLGSSCQVLQMLIDARPSSRLPEPRLTRALALAVRRRMAAAADGPINDSVRRLSRSVLTHAADAVADRAFTQLKVLDEVLQQLTRGIRMGAELDLSNALLDRQPEIALRDWLQIWKSNHEDNSTVLLEAAVFGDGTIDQSL